MREKRFHGTNSMTCANRVLPAFMLLDRYLKTESIAEPPTEIQIEDTP